MSYPILGPFITTPPAGYVAFTTQTGTTYTREYLTLTTSATGLADYPPGNVFHYASLDRTPTPDEATLFAFVETTTGQFDFKDVNSNLTIQYNAVQNPNDSSKVEFDWIGLQIETSSVYKYQNPQSISFGIPSPLLTGYPYNMSYNSIYSTILNPLFGVTGTNTPVVTLIPSSAFVLGNCSNIADANTLRTADQTWFVNSQSGKVGKVQYVTTQDICSAGNVRYCLSSETCGNTNASGVQCYGNCKNSSQTCIFNELNHKFQCIANINTKNLEKWLIYGAILVVVIVVIITLIFTIK